MASVPAPTAATASADTARRTRPAALGDLDLLEEAAELADEDLELADDDLELELADDDLELADDDLELAELELELGGLGWLNERGAFMATDSLRGCF